MALRAFGAVRDLPRLREISSVLIRHGLGDIVRRAAARARRTNITMGRVSGHRSSGTRTAHEARLRGARSDVRKTRSDALDKGRPAASVVDYRTWDAAQPGGARAIRRAPAAGRKSSREVTLRGVPRR